MTWNCYDVDVGAPCRDCRGGQLRASFRHGSQRLKGARFARHYTHPLTAKMGSFELCHLVAFQLRPERILVSQRVREGVAHSI